MYKRDGIKIISLSSFVLVLCLLVISLGTYSLFSQTISAKTHLQAGVLDAKLERTNLKYNELDSFGLLVDVENSERKDFTNTNVNEENIFGVKDGNYIVPGSYYEATMLLTNEGDVAFDYWLEVSLKDGFNTDLKGQIKVTVTTYEEGKEIESISYLKDGLEVGSEILPLDSLLVDESEKFKVKIEFEHSDMNNYAMEEEIEFDLIVYAVQRLK